MLVTGSNGVYQWLVTDHNLDDLLRICPKIVLGKHIAVTSFDSGPLTLSDEEKAAGWESRKNIGYSPKSRAIETLPRDLYDEWYVFENPVDLGELVASNINVFESLINVGQVHVFVNFGGFAFHRPEMANLTKLFWEQIDWIQPQFYIADGDYLTLVSVDKKLFAIVHQAFSELR